MAGIRRLQIAQAREHRDFRALPCDRRGLDLGGHVAFDFVPEPIWHHHVLIHEPFPIQVAGYASIICTHQKFTHLIMSGMT